MLELARAYLALDDVAGASAVLGQARDVLRQRPDLGILPGQVEELWSKLDIMPRAALPGASSLSTAELRLLPLLSTHLSFREIGERLYVSHNTVKTPAISVYRKLEVSSRSQAIEHAQQLGLLPASQRRRGPFWDYPVAGDAIGVHQDVQCTLGRGSSPAGSELRLKKGGDERGP